MSNRKLSVPKPWLILLNWFYPPEWEVQFRTHIIINSLYRVYSTERSASELLTSHRENLLSVGTFLAGFQLNLSMSSLPSLCFPLHWLNSFFLLFWILDFWHFCTIRYMMQKNWSRVWSTIDLLTRGSVVCWCRNRIIARKYQWRKSTKLLHTYLPGIS